MACVLWRGTAAANQFTHHHLCHRCADNQQHNAQVVKFFQCVVIRPDCTTSRAEGMHSRAKQSRAWLAMQISRRAWSTSSDQHTLGCTAQSTAPAGCSKVDQGTLLLTYIGHVGFATTERHLDRTCSLLQQLPAIYNQAAAAACLALLPIVGGANYLTDKLNRCCRCVFMSFWPTGMHAEHCC